MPVQSVTIRAFGMTHTKPLYLCETCLEPASYGYTVLVDNHRKRKWFCLAHRPDAGSGDMGGRDNWCGDYKPQPHRTDRSER